MSPLPLTVYASAQCESLRITGIPEILVVESRMHLIKNTLYIHVITYF